MIQKIIKRHIYSTIQFLIFGDSNQDIWLELKAKGSFIVVTMDAFFSHLDLKEQFTQKSFPPLACSAIYPSGLELPGFPDIH